MIHTVTFLETISGGQKVLSIIEFSENDSSFNINGDTLYKDILFPDELDDDKAIVKTMRNAPDRFTGSYLRATYNKTKKEINE